MTTWVWYGMLGRNFDTFLKEASNEDNEKCVEIIEKNKNKILKAVKEYSSDGENDSVKELLDVQDEFYDWVEEGRTYDYYNGKYIDEQMCGGEENEREKVLSRWRQ